MTKHAYIILAHDSSLSYWRSPTAKRGQSLDAAEASVFIDRACGCAHVQTLDSALSSGMLADISKPLELLTANRNERRSTKRARFHCVQTALPAGALVLVDETTLPDGTAARILGTRTFKPDLYWPEYRMAVEYSNRAWPSAQERLNYDKLVRNAYRMLGITAISLGKDDLSDDARLRKRFELVNRKCKRRLQTPNDRHLARQRELLDWMSS